MPLAGMAAGASDALQELLARAFAEKQAQEQMKLRQAESDRQQQELLLRADNQRADQEYRTGQVARQGRLDAQVASKAANEQGTRTMLGDFLTQRKPGTPLSDQDRGTLETMAVTDNITLPESLTAKPRMTPITTIGPRGAPVRQSFTDEQLAAGVPEYRAPVSGPAPDYVTMASPDGKQQRQVTKGAQANDLMAQGWRQFDPVAARQTASTTAGSSPYSEERRTRVLQSVDELIGQVGNSTVGFGSWLASIPTTDARRFKGQLDTLKANIAFNELTEMREASKTGGALGQIAVRELVLLEATLGALDQGLAPKDLVEQLNKVKGNIERWQAAKAKFAAGQTTAEPSAAPAADASAPVKWGRDASGKPVRLP